MARTRSLAELIDDVRWAADVGGATQRHTNDAIIRALNQSIQAFRLMVSSLSSYYVKRSSTLTLTAGADTITPPTDFVRMYGFDLYVDGEWRELFPFELAERNKYQWSSNSAGTPANYHERNLTTIDIMPTADATYSYRLWYLPQTNDLTSDGDTFDGVAGWEDWIVYDTCLRISTRDAGVNDNYELLTQEFARIDARVRMEAGKRHVPGASRRLDTRGRRRTVEARSSWKWRR